MMRRAFNILETLRKVRPKTCTENCSKTRSVLNCVDELKLDKATAKQRLTVSQDNTLTLKSELDDPVSLTQGSEVLWQNLKQMLLICGGRQEPLRTPNGEIGAEAGVLVDVLEAQRFVSDVFGALNVPFQAASEMADALIAADYMGQRSMGIHRLPAIAGDLLNLTVDPRMQPTVLSDREALALVDGQNAPGPVVANYCMDLAMSKARDQTIGYVAARRSNNIGMSSWYACQAVAQRMIGICMTNGSPIMVPSGGIEPVMGANTIACAAASKQEQFLVDMGMSAYPIEQLELEYSNGYLYQLPPNLALGRSGQPTTCAVEALRAQRLRPFMPEHKGFGLAAMVDILCGVMTGARYSSQLSRRGLFGSDNQIADLGQIYVAIDPMYFSISFEDRLADFQQLLRNVVTCDNSQPPLIPGENEYQHMQIIDDQGGLILTHCTISVLQELGECFNILPLKVQKK